MAQRDYSYYRVRAVEKALSILELFTLDKPELRVVDMVAQLGLHKSTVHRLVLTLERVGYLRRNVQRGSYSLGLRLVELGALAISNLELRGQARPHLERLRQDLGQTVHMAVLDGPDIVYIEKIEGKTGVQLYSAVGRRVPCHCTALGKVLLAFQPREFARDVLATRAMRRYTPSTIVDPDEFLRHLDVVRERGYALDVQEHELLVHCVAAPIRDHTGSVIAAVSVTFIGSVFREDQLQAHARDVLAAADEISRDMGFTQPGRRLAGAATREAHPES